jgi:hypothetical protein
MMSGPAWRRRLRVRNSVGRVLVELVSPSF